MCNGQPQYGNELCFTTRYQIVFYHESSNVINVETTRSRSGTDLLVALQQAFKFFTDRGAAPLLVCMDNECSEGKMNLLATTTPIKFELTPVAQHRTNVAERAISTWKDHFIYIYTSSYSARLLI